MQSDSDYGNNPEYIQEEGNAPASPGSPQLSGGVSSTYRKRQREKKNRVDKIVLMQQASYLLIKEIELLLLHARKMMMK